MFRILSIHCNIKLEGGVSWLYPQPGALCLVNASPVDAPVRLSQGCVIVLGKTNMFRYNDPLEAADLRKTMTEKNRKASLMNQSLMSQSLSDLRYDELVVAMGAYFIFSYNSEMGINSVKTPRWVTVVIYHGILLKSWYKEYYKISISQRTYYTCGSGGGFMC